MSTSSSDMSKRNKIDIYNHPEHSYCNIEMVQASNQPIPQFQPIYANEYPSMHSPDHVYSNTSFSNYHSDAETNIDMALGSGTSEYANSSQTMPFTRTENSTGMDNLESALIQPYNTLSNPSSVRTENITDILNKLKKIYVKSLRNNIIANLIFATLMYSKASEIPYWIFAYLFWIIVIFGIRFKLSQWTFEDKNVFFYSVAAWNIGFLIGLISLLDNYTSPNIAYEFFMLFIPASCFIFSLLLYKFMIKLFDLNDYISCENISSYNDKALLVLVLCFTIFRTSFLFLPVNYLVLSIYHSLLFLIISMNTLYIISTLIKYNQYSKGYIATTILAVISIIMTIITGTNSFYYENYLIKVSEKNN